MPAQVAYGLSAERTGGMSRLPPIRMSAPLLASSMRRRASRRRSRRTCSSRLNRARSNSGGRAGLIHRLPRCPPARRASGRISGAWGASRDLWIAWGSRSGAVRLSFIGDSGVRVPAEASSVLSRASVTSGAEGAGKGGAPRVASSSSVDRAPPRGDPSACRVIILCRSRAYRHRRKRAEPIAPPRRPKMIPSLAFI
jgi:hypothetical protein